MSTFQGGTAYDTYTLAPAGVGIPAKITDYFTGAILTPDEPVKTTKNGAYRTFTITTTTGREVHVVWVEFPGVEPQLQVSVEQQASAGMSGRLTGSAPTEAELPEVAALGDAYVTEDTLDLYVWMPDGFKHVGSMRGPEGAGATDPEIADRVTTQGSETRTAVDTAIDERSRTNSRPVGRSEVPIDVLNHAAAADGTTDDSAALNAAADAARAGQSLNLTTRGLRLPPEATIYINGTVDLRYVINLDLAGRIVVGPSGVLVVGHSSVQRPGQVLNLRDVRHASPGQTNACIRAIGLKQAQVTIGRCSRVELLADDSSSASASLAYNTFYLGDIETLHLKGIGAGGWVNQNTFVGGDVTHTILEGAYPHNENTWVKTCTEGGTIKVLSGVRNRWIESRCEGGTQVTFGAGTARNVIEDSYVSNQRTRQAGAVVVSDLGVENAVISTPDLYLRAHTIASLSARTLAFDGACEVAGQGIVPGLGKVSARGAWQFIMDTGKFPIGQTETGPGNLSPYEPSWKLRRFQVTSDTQFYRLYVTLFDASGAVVTAGGIDAGSGWNMAGDEYTTGSDQKSVVFVITSSTATHAQIRVRGSGTVTPFGWLRLEAFTQLPSMPAGADLLREQVRRPLYQAAKPTQGVAHPGTVVQGPSSSWKATARADTVTTAAAASSASAVSVASAAGIATGDVVGVLLGTGLTHWTTVAGVSGSTVTLGVALPSSVAAGAAVATTRWV